MLTTPQECEEILSILSIRELVAKIADGDIESSYIEQESAVIKCRNIDYMFGLTQNKLTDLYTKIYKKQMRLEKEKRERVKPLNDLINNLKNWNE